MKLYRLTTYLGDEPLGSPLYLSDSENDLRWLRYFKSEKKPTRLKIETFELLSTEEI